MRLVLLLCAARPALAFFAAGLKRRAGGGVFVIPTGQAVAEPLVVIIGRPDGTAATLAHTLDASEGVAVRAVFHNSGSLSAALPHNVDMDPTVQVDLGSSCDPATLALVWAGAEALVIACDGSGPSGTGASEEFLSSLQQQLEAGCVAGLRLVVCVAPGPGVQSFTREVQEDQKVETKDDGLLSGAALGESFSMPTMPKLPSMVALKKTLRGGLGGGRGSYAGVVAAARSAAVPSVVLVRHGRVFGGVPGAPPVAFTTGPRKEPEVNEHYAARAVVLSPASEDLSSDARTSRDALASLVTRLVTAWATTSTDDKGAPARQGVSEMALVSVDGPEPNDAEWASQLSRVTVKARGPGVELLRVTFDAVPRPSALVSWLEMDFAGTVLGTMSTRGVRIGARPVAVLPCALHGAEKTSDQRCDLGGGVRVRWEDVGDDMEPVIVGGLLVRLAPEDATEDRGRWALVVIREGPEDAAGGGSAEFFDLPGEGEFVQRLLEGLEKTVYTKGFATRPGTEAAAAKEMRRLEEAAVTNMSFVPENPVRP